MSMRTFALFGMRTFALFGMRTVALLGMRTFAIALLFTLAYTNAYTQTIHVTNVAPHGTGKMRANVMAFDKTGFGLRTPSSARVLEGGYEAGGIRFECPPPQPAVDVSSVLAIDISGSMAKGGPNIALARLAANAWIDALSETSELAITAFDNTSFVAIDFTNDTSRMKRTVAELQPRGGTNFGAGFLHNTGGAMVTAAKGTKRRVVVFLTDGQGGGNADDVIAAARANDITVYCVTLGMPIPNVLRAIAENTGGLWFENVTTPDEAVMAYRRIFAAATQGAGCTLEWNHTVTCSARDILTFIIDGDTARAVVDTPDSLLVGIRYQPMVIEAGVVAAGQIINRKVWIVAKGGSVTITSIAMNGSPTMSVQAPPLPHTLAANDSVSFTVTVRSGDSAYTIGRVDVGASPCAVPPLYVSSGSGLLPPLRPTLRVVSPNGGERFRVGSVVPLRYEGVPPNVPVQLEVSTNLGLTWIVATQSAFNHRHDWKATTTASDSCLLRASQLMREGSQLMREGSQPDASSAQRATVLMTLKGEKLKQTEYSPNQAIIATSGWEQRTGSREMYGQVRLWNAQTGAPLRVLDGGYHFAFTPDSKSIVTWGEKLVRRYDVASGALTWSAELTPTNAPHTIEVSLDGSNLLVVGGWGDSTILVDAATGRVRRVIPRRAKDVKHATMNADASLVAVADGDSVIRVYEASTGMLKYSLGDAGVKNHFRSAFQPNGSLLAVAAGNGRTSLWDMTDGRKARDVTSRQYFNDNTYVAFSPDGGRLALETERDQTKIFDVASGKELITIQRSGSNTSAYGAVFSPNGQHLALLSFYRLSVFDATTGVQVYQTRRAEGTPSFTTDGKRFVTVGAEEAAEVHPLSPAILQQDVSDARWSLIEASGRLKSVRFSTRLVGQAVDSLITDAITNTGKDTLVVTAITIEGSEAADFAVRTSGEISIPPGGKAPIEYSFTPRAQGELASLLVAHTSAGRLTARITGRALNTLLQVDNGVYDVGTTFVGGTIDESTDDVLRNTTDYPLTLTSFTIANNTDSVFTLKPLSAPNTIAPGQPIRLVITYTPKQVGQHSMNVLLKFAELQDPVVATIIGHGDTLSGPASDPTTFRTIALPSSIIPPAGTITTGVYNVLGLQTGASITDNVMLIAGGVFPLRKSWIGGDASSETQAYAYSIGAKVGVRIDSQWTLAGGYQWGQSVYDQLSFEGIESRITFNALYATVGFGNDDSRASLYIGYAFKRHTTIAQGTFDADATILAAGYDYRIARRWKLCSEIVFMRTMTFVPLTITARYFGETYALEVGVTVLAIPASGASSLSPPLVPMLTWVKRW